MTALLLVISGRSEVGNGKDISASEYFTTDWFHDDVTLAIFHGLTLDVQFHHRHHHHSTESRSSEIVVPYTCSYIKSDNCRNMLSR